MKKSIYFLLLVFILSGCMTAQRCLDEGNYDLAIQKSMSKLQSKRTNEKYANILELAYQRGNDQNLERIKYLKAENTPQGWEEIANLYTALKSRQSYVKPILPIVLPSHTIQFPYIDYDNDIISARNFAANTYFANALTLMKNRDHDSNRKAYSLLVKVQQLGINTEEVENLKKVAKQMGTTTSVVVFANKAKYDLKQEWIKTIMSFGTEKIDNEWTKFVISSIDDGFDYDYVLSISINSVYISPEQVNESRRDEKKQIQDGWEYELDAKGNVKKDTTGKDIKKPKMKTITCTVVERKQDKSAKVSGNIEVTDNHTNQLVRTIEFDQVNAFNYVVYTANGDLKALSDDTRGKLGRTPVAFPSADDLVKGTIAPLRDKVRSLIANNRDCLK